MLSHAHSPGFIEPCLPSPGEQPPTGLGWVHEIKHDGYRLMARRDALSVGIRLLTRNGHVSDRFPLILQAVRRLKVRSCLIDGEAVCCNERGVPSFDKLRHRKSPTEAGLSRTMKAAVMRLTATHD
jgi:bifunctional non-homologous end joining protein LigD